MKLIYRQLPVPHKPRWVCTVIFMHGDSDLYTEHEITVYTEDEAMRFVELVKAMIKDDNLTNKDMEFIHNFALMFYCYSPDMVLEIIEFKSKMVLLDWIDECDNIQPCDKTNDCWTRAQYSGFRIKYYDHNNIPNEVTVED